MQQTPCKLAYTFICKPTRGRKSFSLDDLKDSLFWEKIFANGETNKGLTSKIRTGHTDQNKKKKRTIEKLAKDLNRYFSKKDIQMFVYTYRHTANYCTIALISHTSKVMLKILQARLQQCVNRELPDVQAGFSKGRGTRDRFANIHWVMEKARKFQKNIYFCFTDYAKAFDCVDHNKL